MCCWSDESFEDVLSYTLKNCCLTAGAAADVHWWMSIEAFRRHAA